MLTVRCPNIRRVMARSDRLEDHIQFQTHNDKFWLMLVLILQSLLGILGLYT